MKTYCGHCGAKIKEAYIPRKPSYPSKGKSSISVELPRGEVSVIFTFNIARPDPSVGIDYSDIEDTQVISIVDTQTKQPISNLSIQESSQIEKIISSLDPGELIGEIDSKAESDWENALEQEQEDKKDETLL